MLQLTKDTILGSKKKRAVVDVPDLGGSVTLQRMGALDYWRMREIGKKLDWEDGVARVEFVAAYLAMCIVDPSTGQRMFTDDDLVAIQCLDPEVLDRLFGDALELHGVKPDGVKPDEVEDMEKNSQPTASDDGGSDSPGCADTRTPTTCSPS